MSLYRIYKSDPYAAPPKTVKITYDDDMEEKNDEAQEDLGIEEVSLNESNEVEHVSEEVTPEEQLVALEEANRVLREAEEEADKIIAEAKNEALRIIAQAKEDGADVTAKYIAEGEKQLHVKEEEAYAAAFLTHEEEINQVLKTFNTLLNETINSLKAHDKEYIDSVEESLRGLSLQVAEKILHKELEEDPLAMSCLTFEVLDEKKKSKHVNVVLSNQAKELADYIENELRTNEEYKARDISVEKRDVENGTLLLEHDGGTIDASIKEQLKNLKELFEIE